jgi:hypothetical protein
MIISQSTGNQKWTNSGFEKISLQELGVRIQFGHPDGTPCSVRNASNNAFTVVDVTGVHRVAVDFCLCENSSATGDYAQQILKQEWFPATHLYPRTAFTFRLMELFHLLSLQGKMSMYDFYLSIKRVTDNVGLDMPNVGASIRNNSRAHYSHFTSRIDTLPLLVW